MTASRRQSTRQADKTDKAKATTDTTVASLPSDVVANPPAVARPPPRRKRSLSLTKK
jgi:hypothetical protein